MSKLSHKLIFVNPQEGDLSLPLPTYESLADLTSIKPGSIGKGWVSANSAEEAGSDNALKNRVVGYAGLLKDLYFLEVLTWKVQVLYSWKVGKCRCCTVGRYHGHFEHWRVSRGVHEIPTCSDDLIQSHEC